MVGIYKFADLTVQMDCRYELMKRRAAKYALPDAALPDIIMDIPEARIANPPDRYHHLTPAEIELILTGARFSREILHHEGFVLHASAIAWQNRGILFSADSGVGKSTHTRLWQKRFGPENIPIINDDKPAIRWLDDQFYVCGTPFSGNSEENRNLSVPLHAIVFLKRASTNLIRQLSPQEALPLLMKQTLRPNSSPEHMDLLLSLLNRLLPAVPCCLLQCNMEEEAAALAAEVLFPSGLEKRNEGKTAPMGQDI